MVGVYRHGKDPPFEIFIDTLIKVFSLKILNKTIIHKQLNTDIFLNERTLNYLSYKNNISITKTYIYKIK